MIKHNQDGAISGLLIMFILALLLLMGAIGFGAWAFTSRQDYKANVNTKISAAVTKANTLEDTIKDKQFAEDAKKPLKTYHGPEAYGSLIVNFPKTWSGYVDDSGKGSAQVDGFFAPGVVPSITDQASVFALRIQVVNQSYAQTLQAFTGQQQDGKLAISAYALPKLPKVVGVEVVGEISDQTQVTMVVLPLRSQTLEVWTEGNQYLSDFNNNILPNFRFSP